jgi:hypothetical protein
VARDLRLAPQICSPFPRVIYKSLPEKTAIGPGGVACLKSSPEPSADVFYNLFGTNPRGRKMWDRYRRLVLHLGGSIDAKKILEELLDRPLNPQAPFRRLRMADL